MPTRIAVNPQRPRLVLRIGFAGRRQLDAAEQARLRAELNRIFAKIARPLAALSPRSARPSRATELIGFYADAPPLLRLVTGLCEGADSLAAEALTQLANAGAAGAIATELAAVLPFDPASYRDSRPDWFRADFERQAEDCAYILALDGRYEESSAAPELAKRRRQKAYRAQSALLLRQADLLLAAADPSKAGQAGGTLETVAAALAFGLSVIFIDTARGETRLITPEDELASVLSEPPRDDAQLDAALDDLVRQLLVGPAAEDGQACRPVFDDGDDALGLLREYFTDAEQPPAGTDRLQLRLRKGTWDLLLRWLTDGPGPRRDPPLASYRAYRERAAALNHHYSGQNRGAFLLNYVLAVLVVLLGALAVTWSSATAVPATVLLVVGMLELAGMLVIAENTRAANDQHWNDRAVDYRYLAERLRSLYYLPRVGSFRPPLSARPPARSIPQSPVDWLAEAIARSISPADLPELVERQSLPAADDRPPRTLTIVRLRPRRALRLVQRRWIQEQIRYHRRNAHAMARLERGVQRLAMRLGPAVVVMLGINLMVDGLNTAGRLSERTGPLLQELSPWLALLATVLPAAVVALSGLRFQAEARRLAERSTLLCRILGGPRADQADARPEHGRYGEIAKLRRRIISARRRGRDAAGEPAHPPDIAAWSLDTLLLTERIADDCIREVSEWSVLYRKQVPET